MGSIDLKYEFPFQHMSQPTRMGSGEATDNAVSESHAMEEDATQTAADVEDNQGEGELSL
eukprot:scaffold160624_cov22-Prasinocladus_malaysianus.AAC.1